jgi:hypothetical protein
MYDQIFVDVVSLNSLSVYTVLNVSFLSLSQSENHRVIPGELLVPAIAEASSERTNGVRASEAPHSFKTRL